MLKFSHFFLWLVVGEEILIQNLFQNCFFISKKIFGKFVSIFWQLCLTGGPLRIKKEKVKQKFE